ncbi:hypothetical protein [Dyella terrae]|uniref:hypothetical protein n=1 Tax=Dyella terrae TaxID=522259 RepID=UPI001EFE91AC|nr:hypothetical protein [Dyella terrae]ULU26608.1 hypothetical protein DYST_03554 [Dyella terrae]
MSLREIGIELVLVGAVAFSAYAIGDSHGFKSATAASSAKVIDAEGKARAADARAQASASALDNIKRSLDAQKRSAEVAKQVADKALIERDETNAKLATAIRQRQNAERKAAHESPDCAELVRMPLCPAVAQRLFQPSGQTHTAPAVSH